ncbi:MAG: PIN domain-containing protein [Planctomycetota bacterium]
MACQAWLDSLLAAGNEIVVPEIIDYEIRRELMRSQKPKGLSRLDDFKANYTFLPIDTDTLLKAAEFWAEARWRGLPTAMPTALDIDVILAAQARMMQNEGEFVVIATLNKKHLSQFVPAEHWKDIHAL